MRNVLTLSLPVSRASAPYPTKTTFGTLMLKFTAPPGHHTRVSVPFRLCPKLATVMRKYFFKSQFVLTPKRRRFQARAIPNRRLPDGAAQDSLSDQNLPPERR
jgi:hypothetical protein